MENELSRQMDTIYVNGNQYIVNDDTDQVMNFCFKD